MSFDDDRRSKRWCFASAADGEMILNDREAALWPHFYGPEGRGDVRSGAPQGEALAQLKANLLDGLRTDPEALRLHLPRLSQALGWPPSFVEEAARGLFAKAGPIPRGPSLQGVPYWPEVSAPAEGHAPADERRWAWPWTEGAVRAHRDCCTGWAEANADSYVGQLLFGAALAWQRWLLEHTAAAGDVGEVERASRLAELSGERWGGEPSEEAVPAEFELGLARDAPVSEQTLWPAPPSFYARLVGNAVMGRARAAEAEHWYRAALLCAPFGLDALLRLAYAQASLSPLSGLATLDGARPLHGREPRFELHRVNLLWRSCFVDGRPCGPPVAEANAIIEQIAGPEDVLSREERGLAFALAIYCSRASGRADETKALVALAEKKAPRSSLVREARARVARFPFVPRRVLAHASFPGGARDFVGETSIRPGRGESEKRRELRRPLGRPGQPSWHREPPPDPEITLPARRSARPQQASLDGRVRSLLEAGNVAGATSLALRVLGPEVFGFLVGVLGKEPDADEIFTAACERFWHSLPTFPWRCSLRAWAHVIARREIALFRTSARRLDAGRVRASDLEEVIAAVTTWARTTRHSSERREMLSALRDELPVDDRALLVLRVDRQLAWDEVALAFVDDPTACSDDERKRESARLRKRFQLVKERLTRRARAEGLL